MNWLKKLICEWRGHQWRRALKQEDVSNLALWRTIGPDNPVSLDRLRICRRCGIGRMAKQRNRKGAA